MACVDEQGFKHGAGLDGDNKGDNGTHNDNESTHETHKMPDFSIRMHFTTDSFLNSLVPIVIKKHDDTGNGTLQSLCYLMRRLKCQFELCRDFRANRSGVCIATSGHLLSLTSVVCTDGKIAVQIPGFQFPSHHRLWPTKKESVGFDWSLASLPGLVRLILVFSSSAEQLGYVKVDAHGMKMKEVLGMGAYSTVVRAAQPGAIDVAIKVPRYCSPYADASHDHSLCFRKEVEILSALHACTQLQEHIPSVLDFQSAFPAIVYNEVGWSMSAYVAKHCADISQRRAFAAMLSTTLTPVLNMIGSKGCTHRDIRPQNIVMKPSHTGDGFVPMLIDWGLSGTPDDDYFLHSADFQAEEVLAHFKQYPVAPLKGYKPEYDIKSLEYAITAIVYNTANLIAPWNNVLKETMVLVRERMTAARMAKLLDWNE